MLSLKGFFVSFTLLLKVLYLLVSYSLSYTWLKREPQISIREERFILSLLIYFKLTKLQKCLQKYLQNCSNTTCGMLIKVNSIIYKAKLNVKIKQKIKITYVLIMSISLYQGKSNRKTNKKQALVMDCHQNSVPP